MNRKYTWIILLAAVVLLFTGCQKTAISHAENDTATPETSALPPAQDPSLDMLRQAMSRSQELFAVAYLGQLDEPADIGAYIRENNPQLLQSYPFIGNIPEAQIIGSTGEIYCIIPRDKDASVLAIRTKWQDGNHAVHADTLYQSGSGSPFILLCNSENILDTYLSIITPKGEHITWWPGIDDSFTISLPYSEEGMCQAWDISLYEAGPRDIYHTWYQEGWTFPYEETLSGTQWRFQGIGPDGQEALCTLVLNHDGSASLSWQYVGGSTQEYYHGSWSAWLEHRAFLSLNLQRTGGVSHKEEALINDSFAVLLSPEGDRLLLGYSFNDTRLPLNPLEKNVLAIFDRLQQK